MFCLFVLLSFFPLPKTACLGWFGLKRLTILYLKPRALFPVDPGISLINESYQVF